jgi:hypothetical protein
VALMPALLVSYDLFDDSLDRGPLLRALESSGTYWHYLERTWILKTQETPAEVAERIGALVRHRDRLLVVDITGGEAAWSGLPQDAHEWLTQEL